MKKKILIISVVLLAFTGTFLWFFVQDKVTVDATAEWSELNYVVTSIETNVEGLTAEVSIVYTEGAPSPYLEVSFTNNGSEDMWFGEESIYLKTSEGWNKAQGDGVYATFPIGRGVLCPETVEIGEALLDGENVVTNTCVMRYSPWDIWQSMDSLGEYRFELEIHGKDGVSDRLGTVRVEWTQQLK